MNHPHKQPTSPMGQQTPGLRCPRCNEFIPTTIHELLTASSLWCPHCLLQLKIDRGNSQKALTALKKVEVAQQHVDKTSHRFG